jgi:uncharacterized protein (TIGR02284 family)
VGSLPAILHDAIKSLMNLWISHFANILKSKKMEKETKKTVNVLNKLVEINNDRIEGYETAVEDTDDQDLVGLFTGFASTSNKCKAELVNEIHRLGGEPSEGTNVSGKLYRAWMDIKAALTGNDRKAILNSCEYGEDQAVDTYREVLEDGDNLKHLSLDQQRMIQEQHNLIKADHDRVKAMRDALKD